MCGILLCPFLFAAVVHSQSNKLLNHVHTVLQLLYRSTYAILTATVACCSSQSAVSNLWLAYNCLLLLCLQCFDTVCWASGRASGLQKLSDGVLMWLSVWSEVQIVCIWSSWYHYIPKPCHLLPRLNPAWFGFTFLVPAYPGCPGIEAVKRLY